MLGDIIDPGKLNLKAIKAYKNAGFEAFGDFLQAHAFLTGLRRC